VLRALEELGITRSDLFGDNGNDSDRNGGKKAKRLMCVTHAYAYKGPPSIFTLSGHLILAALHVYLLISRLGLLLRKASRHRISGRFIHRSSDKPNFRSFFAKNSSGIHRR
jgi:hypothetical protein